MSKKKQDTKDHSDSLLENPEALAAQLSRSEEFVEKNKTLVFGLGGVILIVLLGFMGSRVYFSNQNESAQRDMFQAVYYFEMDSLGLALNGDGNNYGFLEIIDEYPMTDASNLANYYAGAIYLKLGDFDNAVSYLSDYSSSDYIIQARAYSLIGDAYMELDNFDEAASYYEKAADYNPNKDLSPTYLQKAAVANEMAGKNSAALGNYQTILDKYFGASEYQDAKKHTARLKGLL